MSAEKKILYPVQKLAKGDHDSHADFLFWCPGCKECHGVWVTKQNSNTARWTFNNNMDRPTFAPSLLITGVRPITDQEHATLMAGGKINRKDYICHSFVTDGNIQFLSDCTHELAGKTVPMEAF